MINFVKNVDFNMTTVKRIFVLCLMIFALYRVSEAHNNGADDKISVAGLTIGNTYTEEQIHRLLRRSDSVMNRQAANGSSKFKMCSFGKSHFVFLDAELNSALIRDSEYPVQGKIRVGDSVDKVKELGGWTDDLMAEGVYIGELRWVPTADLRKSRYAATFSYDSERVITTIRVGRNHYIEYYTKSSER